MNCVAILIKMPVRKKTKIVAVLTNEPDGKILVVVDQIYLTGKKRKINLEKRLAKSLEQALEFIQRWYSGIKIIDMTSER